MKIYEKIIKVVVEFLTQNRRLLNISYATISTSKINSTITTITNININSNHLCCFKIFIGTQFLCILLLQPSVFDYLLIIN